MKRIGDILTRNKTPVVVKDGTSYKQVTIRTNSRQVESVSQERRIIGLTSRKSRNTRRIYSLLNY